MLKKYCGAILNLIKKDTVLTVAWLLAIISSIVVHPDKLYLSYVRWDTLGLILIMILAVEGIKARGVLSFFCNTLTQKVKSGYGLDCILVLSCFFGGMLITNDVALITFVPLGIIAEKTAGRPGRIVPVASLQTIGANLGAMLTPVGNPHNIYFYFLSGVTVWEFLRVTLPFTILGLIMLLIWVLPGKKVPLAAEDKNRIEIQFDKLLWLYAGIFCLGLLSLTKLVSPMILALCSVLLLFIFDRDTLKKTDYSLLLTFLGFFIFIGNAQRMDVIADLISQVISGRELIVSVLLCQVISNLPTALLLSGFTDNWQVLTVGTDIGGLGTLIASMANLITYKIIVKEKVATGRSYLKTFSLLCIALLIPELILGLLIL